MARDFPLSIFVGVDRGEELPRSDIPENCMFVRADALALPFADSTFDYVYGRTLGFCLTPMNWAKVVSEIVRVVKPGGWVELVESDCVVKRPPPSYLKLQDACKCQA